jgi:hypothetical protein
MRVEVPVAGRRFKTLILRSPPRAGVSKDEG